MSDKTTAKKEEGSDHVGQTVEINGQVIGIPHRIEAKGGQAVQDFLVEACAKRGVSHIPEQPKAPEEATTADEQPTAPAPTSSKRK